MSRWTEDPPWKSHQNWNNALLSIESVKEWPIWQILILILIISRNVTMRAGCSTQDSSFSSGDCCRSTFWPVVRTLTLSNFEWQDTLTNRPCSSSFSVLLRREFSLHTRIFSLLIAHLHHWPPRKMEKWVQLLLNSKRDNAPSGLVKTGPMKAKYLRGKFGLASRMAFRKTLLISRSSNDAESSLEEKCSSRPKMQFLVISSAYDLNRKKSARAWYTAPHDGITTTSWLLNAHDFPIYD